MITKRLLETAAMTIIGDSLLCVVSPKRHVGLWVDGPEWWQRGAAPFVRHPLLTRALGLFGVGFGLWLAWSQEPSARRSELKTQRSRWTGRLESAIH